MNNDINDLLKNNSSVSPDNSSGGTNKTSLPNFTSEEKKEELKEKEKEILIAEKEKETEKKALLNSMGYINLTGFPISSEALKLIDKETAAKEKIICFFYSGLEIRLATPVQSNQRAEEILKEFEEKYHAHGELYLVTEKSFTDALKLYDKLPQLRKVISRLEITEQDIKAFQKDITSDQDLKNKIAETSVTDILTLIIAAALQKNASDIHFESEEKEVNIRFRLDGILTHVTSMSPKIWTKVISRIKLVAGLKINIENKPQDGNFSIYLSDDHVDVRISTIPSNYGENVVVRLLRSSQTGLDLASLGVRGKAFHDLEKEIKRPNGMIITTGPTGSGKTTTLYAILSKLNSPKTKIITLENPIEYKLEGITQSQVDPEKDYTFAKGLKTILRQDPDVIMLGEIRDLETADTAINAALTGHLVFSTLHTNDAAGAVPRLLAMDVKPFLLAPAINAVIAQRLVRKICEKCKQEITLDSETKERVIKILSEIPEPSGDKLTAEEVNKIKFYQGKKCDFCNKTGYKGRIGIFEIFPMDENIEKLVLAGKVSEYDMRDIIIKNGMVTMIQDGILKAKDGITSVEEVLRVSQ